MDAPLKVFFGQAAGNGLFLGFDSNADDGVSYDLFAQSAPVQPGGPGGECIFAALYLAMTWDTVITLRVTPIVDEVVYDGTNGNPDYRLSFTLDPADYPGGVQHYQSVLVPLTQPLLDPNSGAELGRFFLRGTSFACIIESVGGLAASGGVTLDYVMLEHEVVSDTKDPVPATVTI